MILGAVYLFIVKPTLDTTNNAINSISTPLKQAEQDAHNATTNLQNNAAQANQNGNQGAQNSYLNQVAKLQACVNAAGKDTAKLTKCAAKYAPQ